MSDDLFKFNAKRTRSQLTLPDDILDLPARSPMKDARIALRNYSTKAAGSHPEDFGESDDELLLSPSKISQPRQDNQQRTSFVPKRSASPPVGDEYLSCSGSPSDGRALKRIKRDVDVNQDEQRCIESITAESRPPSARSRSASQPNMGKSLYSQSRLARRLALSLRTSPVSGKDRARSMPTFPSSFSAPHIDLRNPPPSPRRARSSSPSKETKLRITSGPPQVTKLEIIIDDDGSKPHTGGFILAPLPGTPQPLPISINDHTRRNANQESPTNRREAITCDDSARPSIPTVHELPSTPAATLPLYLTIPLSPLTPLPPTPLPTNSITIPKGRYTAAGWEIDGDEDKDDGMIISSQETKLLPVDATRKSRLPRPSSIMSLTVTGTHHPSPASTLDRKSATLMGPPSALPAGKEPLALEITKQLPVTNAFTILMDRARKGKGTDQPKGKAKETASPIKCGNSSSTLATIGPKRKSGKEIRREMAPPTISIKTRMRPKEKITPKPKPISTSVDVANDNKFYSPPPRAFSPVNASKSNHRPIITPANLPEAVFATDNNVTVSSPGTDSPEDTFQLINPPQVAVSMEVTHATSVANIPQLLSDVAHVPNLLEALAPTANDHSTTSEFQASLPFPFQCNDAAPASVDFHDNCLADPKVNLPPAPTTPVSKLPIVKKIRLATATDRVTRRTSQRQREKQTGTSSQALHNASSIHRGTIPKKPVSPVVSDLSTETVSVSTQEYPQDAMSCPLDVATDPASDEPVVPGSPMKLSSPIRRVLTMQESTIAKLTRSNAVKVVKPPSDTKFASESASPAPTRLVRSTSMISTRPMGGIARTFTGLGSNQCSSSSSSSLSTLANALERLRMPPPERPNTSMGFNRELNTNCNFEPTKYSADDSSVRGCVVESTMLKRTASAEPIESDTGGSGEVHSLSRERVGTAKLYSRSGLIMRGGKATSSHQPRPRICGVGTFGSGRVPKASRKTSLPSVMASPVKGKGTVDDMEESEMDFSGFDAAHPNQTDVLSVSSLAVGGEAEPLARKSPSRRVSLASQALSQSLSSLPPKQTLVMGPPTTPPNRRPGLRSSSSSYPSTSSASRSAISDTVAFMREPTALGKARGGAGSHVSSGKSGEHTSTSSIIPESLKILQDSVIFVDVRTDDGDEAGSLFVEMLEGVGAKILTRVGQTCTHIVYKNGLMSTLTRYRLLRDPKPFVVGIAWVVECVEQRQRIDESKFIVKLDGANVAGTNKRRRSMLPKLIRREAGGVNSSDVSIEFDQSMDASSSITMDENLTPLELARRRRTAVRTA